MALPFASPLAAIPRKAVKWTVAGLPEGADALVLSELARATGGTDILHVARDGQRLERAVAFAGDEAIHDGKHRALRLGAQVPAVGVGVFCGAITGAFAAGEAVVGSHLSSAA